MVLKMESLDFVEEMGLDCYLTGDPGDPEPDPGIDKGFFADNPEEGDGFFNACTQEDPLSNVDVKSDCMWGSHLFGRKRDLSFTLNDLFDSQMGMGQESPFPFGDLFSFGLGTTPPDTDALFFGHHALGDAQAAGEGKTEKAPALAKRVSRLVDRNLPHIEPGRSLLLSSNRQAEKSLPPPPPPHQTFIDHAYFLPSPAKNRTPRDLLTPNETSSSEDDEMTVKAKQSSKKMSTASRGIDKKKIVQAVQSLIKKSPNAKPHTIKFRFRMKFRPSNVASVPSFSNDAADGSSSKHVRRKSALLNPHCPAPLKQSAKSTNTGKGNVRFQDTKTELRRHKKTANELQKIRDHRDLHNTMERQRRIDLRYNFDLLKSSIPDLAINDKASKLNILKHAATYCRKITELNILLKQSVSAESARNATLKKKFQQMETQFHYRRPSARQVKPRRF